MIIRNAKLEDINQIVIILKQVSDMHSSGRPDIFKEKTIKELKEEYIQCINSDERNMIVAEYD